MERYEYLFIDIEWNDPAPDHDPKYWDPVSVALIGTDGDLEIKGRYSASISPRRPKLLTEDICTLVHQSRENLLRANTEEKVFANISSRFPRVENIVVWNHHAYYVFTECAKRTGCHLSRHRVIVLQDILGVVASERKSLFRFDKALTRAGIDVKENYLHYAKHDVEYLHQWYKVTLERYRDMTAGETCIVSQRTRILHTPECRYVKDGDQEVASKDIIFRGYRPCRCCGTATEWDRFKWKGAKKKKAKKTKKKEPKTYNQLTDEKIKEYCESLGLRGAVAVDLVYVRSPYCGWVLLLEGDKVQTVLHENYRPGDRKGTYHKQKMHTHDFFKTVRYIYFHDKDFMKRLVRSVGTDPTKKDIQTSQAV